jgi:catechol 2,3-dioxygenase-like lactoylglutathione lyase family enzyme
MPTFAGVDHLSLTVTDLDVSERFYTDVLGFSVVVDFGTVRSLWHRPTGFFLSLIRHDEFSAGRFSELNPGVDHIGFVATDRAELEAWEGRFRRAGVEFTPIRDMPFGYHLNFRDPDGIALEFMAPNALFTAALQELRERDVPRAEIRARVEELLGISLPVPTA